MLGNAVSNVQKGPTTQLIGPGHPLLSSGDAKKGALSIWVVRYIPFSEAEREDAAGLPLPLVLDFAGEAALWLPSQFTKASLSLFTSTWQHPGTTAG